MIPLSAYVALSAILFMTGLIGVLVRRNFIIVLMSVEIMLNAANINLVAFSHYLNSMAGQMSALFIIAVAAAEAAVGLAIIIVVFRGKMATNVDQINIFKVGNVFDLTVLLIPLFPLLAVLANGFFGSRYSPAPRRTVSIRFGRTLFPLCPECPFLPSYRTLNLVK